MFCPNCAEKNGFDQKFCRACGLNLEKTSLAVSEQLGADSPAGLVREEKALERFGTIAFTGFGIVIGLAVLGIIYAVVANMIWNGSQVLYGVALVAFIVFAALSLFYVFWNETLEEKRQRLRSARPPKTISQPPASSLPEHSTSNGFISITEHTTAKLEAPVRKL